MGFGDARNVSVGEAKGTCGVGIRTDSKRFSSGKFKRCDPWVRSFPPSFFLPASTNPQRNPQTLPNHTLVSRSTRRHDQQTTLSASPRLATLNRPPPQVPTPVVGLSTWVDTKNGPRVNTHKALTGAASVNVGAKTPPGLGCEFFSFTLCVLRKFDGGLKVLCLGDKPNHNEQ